MGKKRHGSGGNNNKRNNNNNDNNNKKRKYGGKPFHKNPKRGGPGILLTCESGREFKCRREAIEILNHYYYDTNEQQQPTTTKQQQQDKEDEKTSDSKNENANNNNNDKSLSLEDELKQLQASNKNSKKDSLFATHETGCKGTVFLVFTKPRCNLIEPIVVEKKEEQEIKDGDKDDNDNEDDDPTSNKDDKVETTPANEAKDDKDADDKGAVVVVAEEEKDNQGETTPAEIMTKPQEDAPEGEEEEEEDKNKNKWDPVPTVRSIVSDLVHNQGKEAPSSRFVTRMIPVQATCYASVEEIVLTTQALLKEFLPSHAKTFCIASKRRICGNLTSDEIIQRLATVVYDVIPDAKVQLKHPDVTIVVEICKTLCGISIVENIQDFYNFNLVVAREEGANHNKEDNDDDDKDDNDAAEKKKNPPPPTEASSTKEQPPNNSAQDEEDKTES